MICRRVGGRAGGWVGPTGTETGRFQPDYPFPPTFPLAEIEKDFLQDKAFLLQDVKCPKFTAMKHASPIQFLRSFLLFSRRQHFPDLPMHAEKLLSIFGRPNMVRHVCVPSVTLRALSLPPPFFLKNRSIP